MKSEKPRHPPGLAVLFLTEMWERFSFYLMIGIFYQYLTDSQTGGMGWDGDQGGRASSAPTSAWSTSRRSSAASSPTACSAAARPSSSAASSSSPVTRPARVPTETVLYLALRSPHHRQRPASSRTSRPWSATSTRRAARCSDDAYTIFYMGINIGAFACNFVAAIVRNLYGLALGVRHRRHRHGLGLVIFLVGQKYVRHADIDPKKARRRRHAAREPHPALDRVPAARRGPLGAARLVHRQRKPRRSARSTTAFLFACMPVVGLLPLHLAQAQGLRSSAARVAALLTIYGVVIVFWMVFHQNSTALTDWAVHNTDRTAERARQAGHRLSRPSSPSTAPPEYFKNASPEHAAPRPRAATRWSARPSTRSSSKKLSREDGVVVSGDPEDVRRGLRRHADRSTPAPAARQAAQAGQRRAVPVDQPAASSSCSRRSWSAFWHFLRQRGREPSTAAKIGVGLVPDRRCRRWSWSPRSPLAGSPEGKVSALVAVRHLRGHHRRRAVPVADGSVAGVQAVARPPPLVHDGRLVPLHLDRQQAVGRVRRGLSRVGPHDVLPGQHRRRRGAPAGAIFALLPWLRRQMAESPLPVAVAHEKPAPKPASA